MPRRLVVASLWPFGIALTSWHYMWRTTPLHRREMAGSFPEDAGPDLPDDASLEDSQPADDGIGPLFHRRYRARIVNAHISPEDLIAAISADPNDVAPTEFARFNKVEGDEGRLASGDRFVVRMPGPWDGPVRVVDQTPTSFRLATMQGHLEAGQIEFRAVTDGDRLVFTIESWARSGDRLSNLLYGRLHMAKEVQLHMWTSVMERAISLTGGRMSGGVDIQTRRVDDSSTGGEQMLGDPRARQVLDSLHDRSLNFELGRREGFTAENGWHVDNYCQFLAAEVPGPPSPGGSWQVAQRLMRNYEFADPSIVRAVYYPDRPIDERDMLLQARFYGLRFKLGVRVGGLRDERCEVGGRQVQIWGWNYRTLQGHLEMGQMDYEVWKWLDTGQVEFRISAYSRRAQGGNPVVRLGFRVFGRHEQVKFARRACVRMAALVEAALQNDRADGVAQAGDAVVLRPTSDGPTRFNGAGPERSPERETR
ncbi:MAG: DUF1990 domain-containing protein [Actinomycetota bacterium]|nr:DUF1990 domain-containing protein [Actinomycetota bacterium]